MQVVARGALAAPCQIAHRPRGLAVAPGIGVHGVAYQATVLDGAVLPRFMVHGVHGAIVDVAVVYERPASAGGVPAPSESNAVTPPVRRSAGPPHADICYLAIRYPSVVRAPGRRGAVSDVHPRLAEVMDVTVVDGRFPATIDANAAIGRTAVGGRVVHAAVQFHVADGDARSITTVPAEDVLSPRA